MATRKTRTDAEKERDKDKRLQRKFGIDIVEFHRREAEQKRCCKICGGLLTAFGPPVVDHFHFRTNALRHFDSFLLTTHGWDAEAYDESGQVMHHAWALTKAHALRIVKIGAMPKSIRGLLCYKCNYALGVIEKFFNAARNPEILIAVRDYLILARKRVLTSR